MAIPTRPRRLALALAAGVLLATGATACEPTPPPAFTVDTQRADADVDPGDGTCATAEGECSLHAAVEEANALGTPVDITVPRPPIDVVPIEVTGSVTIRSTGPSLNMMMIPFAVAEGAQLTVIDAAIGGVVVDGAFSARRVVVNGGGPGAAAMVDVGPTGRAILSNTLIEAAMFPAAHNAGTLVLHSTTMGLGHRRHGPAVPALVTEEGALTRLSASLFVGDWEPNPACGGQAPVSDGFNLAPEASCGLAGTGDRQDVVEPDVAPDPGSPAIDAVPAGALYCGAGWDDDLLRGETAVRPADGDGDGTAACDIGAVELVPR